MLPVAGSAGFVRRGPRYYPVVMRHGIKGEIFTGMNTPVIVLVHPLLHSRLAVQLSGASERRGVEPSLAQ